MAKTIRYASTRTNELTILMDDFVVEKDLEKTCYVIAESIELALYEFSQYKSQQKTIKVYK